MPPTLWTSSRRYLQRHPWLVGLSVLGVALGVAVVVAIDLANTSASRAFALSAESVAGQATHQIVGAGGGLDEGVYRRVRIGARYRRAAPVVQGYATLADSSSGEEGRTFQVLGVDPLAEASFRPYVGGAGSGIDLGAFMAEAGAALLSAPTAEALGLDAGDTLRLNVEGMDRALRLVGVIEPETERSRRALENLLVTDVATAQELLGMEGQLSRVDLILPDDAEETRRRIESVLPAGVEIQRSEARTETVEQMTRAFNLNLQALSLLALIVGMFLIYNTMTFSVVQRRSLIGRLRALGVTRREVFTLVLGEALFIGAVGTAVGLLLGIVLARGLVLLITQTINDLYFVLTVRELAIAPLTLVKGAALGLGATLVAALAPAREATNAPVSAVLRRSEEETNLRRLAPRLALGGVALGALGVGLLLVPGKSIWLGYAALFCVLMAAALLVPLVVMSFAALLRPVMGRLFGVLGRMAARGLRTTLSRTAVAIAALMVAVAATVGVGVMVDSFRQTVQGWLEHSLQADVYVQPPSLVFRRSDATLAPGLADTLRQVEGVAAAYSVRRVEVGSSEGATDLVAIETGPNTRDVYRLKAGDPGAVWPDFAGEKSVIISEPYAYRSGLGVGDTLRLQTDRGPERFPIEAVFYDYASDRGVAVMHRATYERFYDDRAFSGIAFDAAEGVSADALMARLRDAAARSRQEVLIRSNRGLRETSLQIFDRTFTITNVLRLLAVLVAFVGVLSALMALQLERARELAVLRAGGMTPGQVGRYVTMQTGVMGLAAGLLSIPLGLALAYVLIFVINKRSFGWTLQLEVAPWILGQAVLLALVAALLAGLYPSWKMARANPARALREE